MTSTDSFEAKEVQKLLKNPSSGKIIDGKLFLVEPPEEMHADVRDINRVLDKKFWSRSRLADLEFYKKELAETKPESIFLDVGAGTGLFREVFSKFRYIGLDLYPYDVVTLVADIRTELPLADNTCDIVMLSNVIEHTPTPQILLNECYRVLKPGGRLIGSVPFLAHVHQEPYDFMRYTHHMLERMMKESGFGDTSVIPLEKPVDFYEWARSRFFQALLYKTKLNPLEKLFAWIAYYIVRLTNMIFAPLFEKVGQSYQLARRFGFSGYKK